MKKQWAFLLTKKNPYLWVFVSLSGFLVKIKVVKKFNAIAILTLSYCWLQWLVSLCEGPWSFCISPYCCPSGPGLEFLIEECFCTSTTTAGWPVLPSPHGHRHTAGPLSLNEHIAIISKHLLTTLVHQNCNTPKHSTDPRSWFRTIGCWKFYKFNNRTETIRSMYAKRIRWYSDRGARAVDV